MDLILLQIQPDLDLGTTHLWDRRTVHPVSAAKEAVQFSDSIVTSLFASFDTICGMAMNFVFLSSR